MTETKVVKSSEKVATVAEEKPNWVAEQVNKVKKALPHKELETKLEDIKPLMPPPVVPRREKAPMNYEYMNQMTSMMVLANLYNCSPGRSPEVAARAACDAADALCHEWMSRQPEVSKRKK